MEEEGFPDLFSSFELVGENRILEDIGLLKAEPYYPDSDHEYESPFATKFELQQVQHGQEPNHSRVKKQKRCPSGYTLFIKDFVRKHWEKKTATKNGSSPSTNGRPIDQAIAAWGRCSPAVKAEFDEKARSLKSERRSLRLTKQATPIRIPYQTEAQDSIESKGRPKRSNTRISYKALNNGPAIE